MLIKKILLLFWALFFSLVFLTDLTDGLKAMGVLPDSWKFASTNFGFMVDVTSIYGTPVWIVVLLFVIVILWAGAAAAAFWDAFRHFTGWNAAPHDTTHAAFALGTGLWAAFLIADEFFLAYLSSGVNATHFRLLIAQLVTLLVVVFLPDGTGARAGS